MNFIKEQGSLPDPQQQHKVHPLDLPEARKEYLAGWWLGVVATPQLFIALAAVLLSISNNVVTPVLAPLITVGITGFVGRQFIRRSWDFVPRKRQDTNRILSRLTIWSESVKALALLLGLVFFLSWAAGIGTPSDVVTYSVGAARSSWSSSSW
ncbi:hypothetical protein [Arthrobacter sp. OAP107]|uniref:hypothetical protein n=1 Tax=Arthrobacter sp. OAP107 TaxID=3156445 RepID=UPI003390851B